MAEFNQIFTIQRQGSYFYGLNDQLNRVGHIHFYIDDKQRYVIDSTVVNIDYRGRGLANQLLNAVIALAREEKKYIYPLCSFAVKVLQNERYRDLWDPQEGTPSGGYCSWIPGQ
jgi:predicted GNAT family acetyltransferase